jgi:hypothetical protein
VAHMPGVKQISAWEGRPRGWPTQMGNKKGQAD